MALRKFLILRKPRSGCLEGRTALIQPMINFFTCPFAGKTMGTAQLMNVRRNRVNASEH